MLAVVVGVIVVSAAGVAAFTVFDAAKALGDNAVVLDRGRGDPAVARCDRGRRRLLIVGTDSCEGQDVALFPRCANNDSPGERNDVTMLVHITDNPRRVTVVSFPRDMLVRDPGLRQARRQPVLADVVAR